MCTADIAGGQSFHQDLRLGLSAKVHLQVAMEKTKGNTVKAIEVLRTYLDTFMTDKDAWAELGDLYLEVSQELKACDPLQLQL